MKKTWKIICIAVIAVLAVVLIIYNSTSASSATITGKSEVSVNENFGITVTIESDEGISGVKGDISYAEMFKSEITENDINKLKENGIYIGQPNNGSISFSYVYLNTDSQQNSISFVLPFSATEEGTGNIDLTNLEVNGSATDGGICTITAIGAEKEEFKLENASPITMKVGDTALLKGNYSITGCEVQPTGIVTVDDSGNILAIAAGEATVTATSDEGTAQIAVIVEDALSEKLTLTVDKTSIEIGEKATITANQPIVSWAWNNTNVAEVADGIVKGKGEGTVTITATAENGEIATINVTVTAKQQQPSEQVPVMTLSETNISVKLGDTSKKIKIFVNDVEYTGGTIWSSNNSSKVIVGAGNIIPISLGSATVTAEITVEGHTLRKTAIVTVVDGDNPVVNPSGDISLTVGQSQQVIVDRNVTWSSNNVNVATVDASGKVTAIAAGEAIITATDANKKSTSVKVIVTAVPDNNDNGNNNDNNNVNNNGSNNGSNNENNNGNNNVSNNGSNNGANKENNKGTGSTTTNKTGNGTTTNGNTSSSANTTHPATGESTIETLVLIGIVTLIVATIIFRRKSKLK